MSLLTFALFVSCLISPQLVQSQEVDSRSGSMNADKVNVEGAGGGQSRTIYSQRHISPHRMMHFGKRPLVAEPPTILAPQAYDLYQPGKYPYLLHIELEQGQTLQAVPEDMQPAKNLLYNYDYPQFRGALADPQQQQKLLQQLATNPLAGQRLSRLMALGDANAPTSSSSSSGSSGQTSENNSLDNEMFGSLERAQPSSNEDGQQGNSNKINVNTRSAARPNTMNLPKGFISNMLYGRSSSSSMPSFGGFNKKAEPKDNFFMHFGRK